MYDFHVESKKAELIESRMVVAKEGCVVGEHCSAFFFPDGYTWKTDEGTADPHPAPHPTPLHLGLDSLTGIMQTV